VPTQEKICIVEELTNKLERSKGAVLVDYRGLNVADLTALRRRLREQMVELRIVKNTLLQRAATAANISAVDQFLTGPTAIAISEEDEVAPARVLTEITRAAHTPLTIKGGIYGRHGVSVSEVQAIAALPPREVLLARLLGLVQAPAAAALSVIQAPARQILYALEALREKSTPAEPTI
jgi:large subunit ribosomal protein L10